MSQYLILRDCKYNKYNKLYLDRFEYIFQISNRQLFLYKSFANVTSIKEKKYNFFDKKFNVIHYSYYTSIWLKIYIHFYYQNTEKEVYWCFRQTIRKIYSTQC